MVTSSSTELRMLIVEDDPQVVRAIRDNFAERRIAVHHAPTLADGMRLLSLHHRYDAIVLDLTLPDGDGLDIADAVRKSGSDIPIVVVTAKDSVDERIAGLSHGADDYLCKPFAIEELTARLEAVLRRSRPKNQYILKYHDIELDLLRRRVRRNDIDRSLSSREMDLLAYLMRHPEEVLSKERILREVWGDELGHDYNVLHVYANYLRNILGGAGYPRIIHTVRGIGYVLSRQDPEDGPPTAERRGRSGPRFGRNGAC